MRLYYFYACLRSCLMLKHASAEKITSVRILFLSFLVAKNCYTDKAVFIGEMLWLGNQPLFRQLSGRFR